MNIDEIEKEPGLRDAKYRGKSVWLLLRAKILLSSFEQTNNVSMSFRERDCLFLIKNLIGSIYKLLFLRKYDYWIYTNSDKRRLIDGKFKDIFFDELIDKIGPNKSIFIEYVVPQKSSINSLYSKHIINDSIFKFLSYVFSLFVNLNNVSNISLIQKIIIDNGLKLSTTKTIRVLLGEYNMYRFFLRICKPKAIFSICYYSKIPLQMAANDLGIPTFEYQHGVINKYNNMYHTAFPEREGYFPKYLFSFGTDLIREPITDFIYTPSNILPLGSYYLDYIKNNYSDAYLDGLHKHYSDIICVTSSGISIEKLMDFTYRLADSNPSKLFIMRNKRPTDFDGYILRNNMVLLPQYDIYQVLKYCSYNISMGSFVAYEANYLGVINILFNCEDTLAIDIHSAIYDYVINRNDLQSFTIPSKKEAVETESYFVSFKENLPLVINKIIAIIEHNA